MSFHKQTWPQRLNQMGDQAEGIYETVYGETSERFGFNRPCFPITRLPHLLRCAPDYIEDGKRFVEVQGFSTALKVKVEKIAALHHWAQYLPVDLFFYSSTKDDWCEIRLPDFMKLTATVATLGSYADGDKPYFRFTPSVLTGWASEVAEVAP
jgi:hypothetical protein